VSEIFWFIVVDCNKAHVKAGQDEDLSTLWTTSHLSCRTAGRG
jgi:hypothetical protein